MEIEFNLSRRAGIFLLVGIILVLGGLGVYAYGTNNPSNLGHSGEEIEVTYDGVDIPLGEALDAIFGVGEIECSNEYQSVASSGSYSEGSSDCDSFSAPAFERYFSVGGWCTSFSGGGTNRNCRYDRANGLFPQGWYGKTDYNNEPLGITAKCCRSKITP